jgi:hypothetical protein
MEPDGRGKVGSAAYVGPCLVVGKVVRLAFLGMGDR